VNVRFGMPWTPNNGAGEVVTDGNGNARTQTMPGMNVDSLAFLLTPGGAIQGTSASGAANAGTTFELKVANNSPLFNLNLGHLPGSGTPTLTYKLDGQTRTMALARQAAQSFRVLMPDNGDHQFQVVGIAFDNGAYAKAPLPGALSVHRNGSYNLSADVVKDVAGRVRETVAAGYHNDKGTATPADGDGLPGASVTGFGSDVAGANKATSGNDGAFKLTLWGDQALPGSLTASYLGLSGAAGSPYEIRVATNASYTLKLAGTYTADMAGSTAQVVFTVDGVEYNKAMTIGADGTLHFVFARDKNDNSTDFKLKSIAAGTMVAIAPFPTAAIAPGASAQGTATLVISGEAAKYHQ
jgi:hypothetical protein